MVEVEKAVRPLEWAAYHKLPHRESWPWWKFYGALFINRVVFKACLALSTYRLKKLPKEAEHINEQDLNLLPCPFCEGTDTEIEILPKPRRVFSPKMYRVRCNSCWIHGAIKFSETLARAAWNTRASPTTEEVD